MKEELYGHGKIINFKQPTNDIICPARNKFQLSVVISLLLYECYCGVNIQNPFIGKHD